MAPALFLRQDVDLALELRVGRDGAGLRDDLPRSTSSFFVPRSRRPTLSPAMPWSRILRNISTEVVTVFWVGRKPTISTSSPGLMAPSILPVTMVPRPEMVKTSSTGIRKGLSVSRAGSGYRSRRQPEARRCSCSPGSSGRRSRARGPSARIP